MRPNFPTGDVEINESRSFTLNNPQAWDRAQGFITNLSKAKPWVVEIRPYRKDRSRAQNRLYWRWLTIIGAELGYAKEEAHETFKKRFMVPIMLRDDAGFSLLWQRLQKLDSVECERQMVRFLSTTDLNTAQFAEYLTDIERMAADAGIVLPKPDDLYWDAIGRDVR